MKEVETAKEREMIKENFLLPDLNKLKKEPSNSKRNLVEARMNLMSGLFYYESNLR